MAFAQFKEYFERVRSSNKRRTKIITSRLYLPTLGTLSDVFNIVNAMRVD